MYTAHLALSFLPNNNDDNSPSPESDKHILLVSSIAGLLPLPGQTEYTVSKHAVMGLFRALRATAWTRGVRVNVLNPYFVETPLLPPAGMVLLAGGGKGRVEDVVDAATRFMADGSIKGRGLVVGPRMRVVDSAGDDRLGERREGDVFGGVRIVEEVEGEVEGERRQGVWEVYGHDYERVEVFVWRYLALLNVMKGRNGVWGTLKDLWRIFVTGKRRVQ
ncbi:hypothetical protein VTI74DRAFT_1955 [Chaetomium olivicolor]